MYEINKRNKTQFFVDLIKIEELHEHVLNTDTVAGNVFFIRGDQISQR